VNVTKGEGFFITVELQYPCDKVLKVFIDSELYEEEKSYCKKPVTRIEFDVKHPQVRHLKVGYHDIKVVAYQSGLMERTRTFSTTYLAEKVKRLKVIPKMGSTTTIDIFELMHATTTTTTSTTTTTTTTTVTTTSTTTTTTTTSTTTTTTSTTTTLRVREAPTINPLAMIVKYVWDMFYFWD
ncbi:hypothetical protein ACFLRF_05015, partial [Candidatus Altiarchaeota archaeon]